MIENITGTNQFGDVTTSAIIRKARSLEAFAGTTRYNLGYHSPAPRSGHGVKMPPTLFPSLNTCTRQCTHNHPCYDPFVPRPHNKQSTQQMKLSQKKLTILMIFFARRKFSIVAGGRLLSPCFCQNRHLMSRVWDSMFLCII